MYQDKVVLCGANSYEEKYYLNPDFDVTIVYEGNIETQEWLYYEQDGICLLYTSRCV